MMALGISNRDSQLWKCQVGSILHILNWVEKSILDRCPGKAAVGNPYGPVVALYFTGSVERKSQ